MTIRITINVHCDYCPNRFHGVSWTKPMARQARELARAADWIARRSGGGEPMLDICPECQEKERERGKAE